MVDVLMLRDAGWLLRYLGWSGLFLLFTARLEPREHPFGWKAAGFLLFTFLPIVVQYNALVFLLYDILLRGLCWLALCLLLKRTDVRTALYGAVALSVLNDLTKIISHDLLFSDLLAPWLASCPSWLCSLLYTALNLAVGLALVLGIRRYIFAHDKSRLDPMQMALVLMPSAVYFYARNFQFELINHDQARFHLHVCILLLLLGFSNLAVSVLVDNSLSTRLQQEELRHMEALIRKQHEEFLAQKSASEAVQQKYHDLKNCLVALRAAQGASPARTQLIDEIDQLLRPLEASLETGNEFLNIILAEKSALCQRKQIRLTSYVDGQQLGFLDGLDLCVLVGNALDNAIEATENLPPERREVHVKISCRQGMALFTFQNYYTAPLQKNSRGFYRTSKQDAENHGYGLKGIAQIAEKYGGTAAVHAEDQEFVLNILIPVPEQNALHSA